MRSNGRHSTTYPHRHRHGGYEYDHRMAAQEALGRSLPDGVEIHHWRGDKDPRAIVVCQDRTYHRLLERRQRALKACGHADWLKCWICGRWDDPARLYVEPRRRRGYHRDCYNRRRAGGTDE